MSRKKRRELREEMRLIISNLDARWLSAASAQLCQQLNDLIDHKLDREIEHVLAFSSFFPGEIDLTDLIVQQVHKRRVYLPRISSTNRLSFFRIEENWINELERGPFGIPVPKEQPERAFDLEQGARSVVILPGLAFDRDGNRLSRDRGSYDIFLRKTEMLDALKLGVCWSLQILPEVPSESYQVMVDWVCHERECVCAARQFDEDFEQ